MGFLKNLISDDNHYNEKAFVGKHIADLIFDITNIIKTEEFIDTMENLQEKFNHE